MSLTLNIPKEQRESLLTAGPKALRPLFQKFFKQSDANKAVKSLRQLRRHFRNLFKQPNVSLSDVVRPTFEPEDEDDEDGVTHPLHQQFVEELADTIAKIMVYHRGAATPFAKEKKRGQEIATPLPYQYIDDRERDINNSKQRKEIIQRISQQDEQTMSKRLRTEPESPPNIDRWIKKLTDHHSWREFTHEAFPTSRNLWEQTNKFTKWAVDHTKEALKDGRTLASEALMNDLLEAMAECESIESYLSISMCIFWVATELWDLQYYPDWAQQEYVTSLLRYYVAAALLEASVV